MSDFHHCGPAADAGFTGAVYTQVLRIKTVIGKSLADAQRGVINPRGRVEIMGMFDQTMVVVDFEKAIEEVPKG